MAIASASRSVVEATRIIRPAPEFAYTRTHFTKPSLSQMRTTASSVAEPDACVLAPGPSVAQRRFSSLNGGGHE